VGACNEAVTVKGKTRQGEKAAPREGGKSGQAKQKHREKKGRDLT